ncbi:hypothetical protein [Bacillus wiedmannii]|uniref:hypothetical protein n=1 Tax=Bacillus wiedmannii TaxID=1890302 RepID=UPI000BF1003D|nr:hypothetical protein [Bacillus wiedmannii]PEJ48385.1 hypothetical protein CN672_13655 [Bacillus wiedmannii]PEM10329.1 hypothetical protein CN610_14175 [Bacillus wiedmannii]PGD08291.1 hypothetical protein COM34_14415 [Bacillus wiedmannii]PHD09559.1 hypothetical protein COF45_17850 [Bacillus wiedmannii]
MGKLKKLSHACFASGFALMATYAFMEGHWILGSIAAFFGLCDLLLLFGGTASAKVGTETNGTLEIIIRKGENK